MLFIAVAVLLVNNVVGYCVIPDFVRGYAWKYGNSNDGRTQKQVSFTAEKIIFRNFPDNTENTLQCVEMIDVRKFIFKEITETVEFYKCVEILERSKSIIQLKTSDRSAVKSRDLCIQSLMTTDPWLLISFDTIRYDFAPCPFSGGFNMKVMDWTGVSHSCNYMELPMRFESDCIAGEGVTFDFREEECTGFIRDMYVFQKTMCITSWHQRFHIFIVIRSVEKYDKLWILRVPIRIGMTHAHELQIHLFSDLVALDITSQDSEYIFYRLLLNKVVQRSLCADEYHSCAVKECSEYIKKQCPKSCGVCEVNKPLPVCSFPRRFRGSWYMQDESGSNTVNISDSTFMIKSVGSFSCVQFEDSPPSKKRIYTTESTFYNGCRPRFTCLSFRRLAQTVISYSISQSFAWPFESAHPGRDICSGQRFSPDDEPIGDKYRNYAGTFKPLLPLSRRLQPLNCRLDAAYDFEAIIRNTGKCSGSLYEDCANSSIIRIDYGSCRTYPTVKTYACAARFKDRYWETLIVLQNIYDSRDSSCLVFSTMKKNTAIILPSSQCDQYSWQFVDNGLRTTDVTFTLKRSTEKCRHIPTTTTEPTTTFLLPRVQNSQRQVNSRVTTLNSVNYYNGKKQLVKYETSSKSIKKDNFSKTSGPTSGGDIHVSFTSKLCRQFIFVIVVFVSCNHLL